MKMGGKLLFFISLFVFDSSAKTLAELEALSPNPLYFDIPITEYRFSSLETCSVGKECAVDLGVDFAQDTISVVTDRPIRETDKIPMTEFMDYITSTEKAGLVFTLDIRDSDKVVPVSFMIKAKTDGKSNTSSQQVTYDEKKKQITAKASLNINDKTLVDKLNAEGKLVGDGAVLNVEG